MRISATINSIENSNSQEIHTYKVEDGGGILKNGGSIRFAYGNGAIDGLRSRPSPVTTNAKHKTISPRITLGTKSKSTLPLLSEGIGIPYVAELQIGGKTKFQGHFDKKSLVLESKGITEPSANTRALALNNFLEDIVKNNNEITSISGDAKGEVSLQIGYGFMSSTSSSFSTKDDDTVRELATKRTSHQYNVDAQINPLGSPAPKP